MEVRREIEITNELGMHARAAAAFVKVAGKYASDIKVEKDGHEVNGKSIMGLMMLAASKGSVITLKADGVDSEAAADSICKLVQDKFGEEK